MIWKAMVVKFLKFLKLTYFSYTFFLKKIPLHIFFTQALIYCKRREYGRLVRMDWRALLNAAGKFLLHPPFFSLIPHLSFFPSFSSFVPPSFCCYTIHWLVGGWGTRSVVSSFVDVHYCEVMVVVVVDVAVETTEGNVSFFFTSMTNPYTYC